MPSANLKTSLKPLSNNTKKLGILAGKGSLPGLIVSACESADRPYFIVAFEGETPAEWLQYHPHSSVKLAQVGKTIALLEKENVEEVVLAGGIKRPSFGSLKPDMEGAKLLTKMLTHRIQGDNAILTTVVDYLQEKGFTVVGADDIVQDLLSPFGVLGEHKPDAQAEEDIECGMTAAKILGQADIGQAVVAQQGIILGAEAVEGTDELIKRCQLYRREGKGGVLVKVKKPQQERRVDLPTIGLSTVQYAHQAGLRGIAIEAAGSLILDREAVIAEADSLGLFVVGVEIDN